LKISFLENFLGWKWAKSGGNIGDFWVFTFTVWRGGIDKLKIVWYYGFSIKKGQVRPFLV
jgi:hypothetical protein